MTDQQLIEWFQKREERALQETEKKYGRYCFTIAQNILHSQEDAEEVVNDVLAAVWNLIPPNCPESMTAYLGRITRNIALKKFRSEMTLKRGNGAEESPFEELEECIPASFSIDDSLENSFLSDVLNHFLEKQKKEDRMVFVRRYWFSDSIQDIAKRFGYSEVKVKSMLKRTRDRLRVVLEKEDIWI